MLEAHTIISLSLQMGTAIAVAFGSYYAYKNNQISHATSAKVDVTSKKVDEVKVLANGNTSDLAAMLATEQEKNKVLSAQIAALANKS